MMEQKIRPTVPVVLRSLQRAVHTHPAKVCGEMINFHKVLSGCSFGCSKTISLIRSVPCTNTDIKTNRVSLLMIDGILAVFTFHKTFPGVFLEPVSLHSDRQRWGERKIFCASLGKRGGLGEQIEENQKWKSLSPAKKNFWR